MLLGLRGVGKTVLLNEILSIAEKQKLRAFKIEATDKEPFLAKFAPRLRQTLLQVDRSARTKAQVNAALGALRNLVGTLKIKLQDVEFSVTPTPGVADSGDLSSDLTDLLVAVGRAAEAGKTGIAILIDEVQSLAATELSALIMALHEVSQRGLPVTVFGAGLPQMAKLATEAKSYAERLFEYPPLGPLDAKASAEAIRAPIEAARAKIEPLALSRIVKVTEGYPFFLQEWGYQAWNLSPTRTIAGSLIPKVSRAALSRLDKGFFRSRIDRMTEREEAYVSAMAEIGSGPYGSGEIARVMGVSVSDAAPIRQQLIKKGMIYSPARGETAFTVPMFDAYIRRTVLNFESRAGAASKRRRSVRP